jgi:hypothetical protein
LFPLGQVRKLTQASNKTFLAADVLGFTAKTKQTGSGPVGTFIVRYKEK